MRRFPDILHVKNKNNLKTLHYKRSLCYFRRFVYEHLLRHEETEYIDLDSFNKQYVGNMDTMKLITKTIIEELACLDWKCSLSFGGTGLFIYSDKPPANCWIDNL